jgi:hypothetical protein
MRTVLAAALLLPVLVNGEPRQSGRPWIAVGVVDAGAGGQEDVDAQLRKLRFNVVGRPEAGGGLRVDWLARGSALPPRPPAEAFGRVRVEPGAGAAEIRRRAWEAIASGRRGVLFDDWSALRASPEALGAAAAFADTVLRNAALFAPLAPSERAVRVEEGAAALFVRFLESPAAIVLVATNPTGAAQRITLAFTAETPEAVWQNMESGGAVNFVAGPEGPIYTRTLAAQEAIVLMIRKQWR